ncbi:gamma-mobile-trio protein GmtX [Aliiglaciecola sp.]|nr:gamma-mobile-trio protein GmtX [Aliiglaciecola sp.]
MTPEQLLNQLKTNSSRKIQTTLDAIYKVCSEQRERSIDDYSIATISRLGAGRGVPAAQSIRNKSGEKYRALIKSFEDSSPVKDLAKGKSSSQDWIDEIANPKRSLMRNVTLHRINEGLKRPQGVAPQFEVKLQLGIFMINCS